MKVQAAQSQHESLIINMCVSFCIILKMAVIIKDLYVGIEFCRRLRKSKHGSHEEVLNFKSKFLSLYGFISSQQNNFNS